MLRNKAAQNKLKSVKNEMKWCLKKKKNTKKLKLNIAIFVVKIQLSLTGEAGEQRDVKFTPEST